MTDIIESANYIFVAEAAFPTGSKNVYLTSRYTLELSERALVAYLPYFGRAFQTPVNYDGGIQFESTQFSYSPMQNKEGWVIEIVPKDIQRGYTMVLDVNYNGTAFLSVNSMDRQRISFQGYVENKSR